MKRKSTSPPRHAEKKIKLSGCEELRSDVSTLSTCLASAYAKLFGTDPDVAVASASRYQLEMQEIYNAIKELKEDLEDPKVQAPIFGAMNKGKSYIANFLLLAAHPNTRDITNYRLPLPSCSSVNAATKVPVRIKFCASKGNEVRLHFVKASTSEIEDRLKEDSDKLTKLQVILSRADSDRYKDYCAPLNEDSIEEIHRRLSSPTHLDEHDDIALSHFVLHWPTDSVALKNLELVELPGIGENNWRANRIIEMVKDSDVVFGPFSIRDDYVLGLQLMHYYGLINDTQASSRLPWVVPIINVSMVHPNIPPSMTLENDSQSIESSVRQKMDEALSLKNTRADVILFDRMNNSNRLKIAQKVKSSMRILHFYPNTVGSGAHEYNFLKEFEAVVRDFKKQKQQQIVQEVMKKSNSFMCLANMFLYRRNISTENQEAARKFKEQLDEDLKEIKSLLEVSLKDVRRKLQSRFELLCDDKKCDVSMAADFIKLAAFGYAKSWKEKLSVHHDQLIDRCHTLVCDKKDDEYIHNVKDALATFCNSRLEKFKQTASTLPEQRWKLYQKLIKLVKKQKIKAGGKFIESMLKSLPCVIKGKEYFAEIQEFVGHLIFTEDGKILAVRTSTKVADEIRKAFNECKKIIRDKYNMAPPRGKQVYNTHPTRLDLAPLPEPEFYETVVKKYTDNNYAKNRVTKDPPFFGIKFTEDKTNAEKNQLVVNLNQNLQATITAAKSFPIELAALSTRLKEPQKNTIAPWFIIISKSEIEKVEDLLKSHTIQDLIARDEKPVIIVHIKDNNDIVKFRHDCIHQLVIKSTQPLSSFGKVEVIKQLADHLVNLHGIAYYWFQIGPISLLREYNAENNQMEVTDPARALLLGQMTFLSFRKSLVKEQCDFLNTEKTKTELVNIYTKHPNFVDIVKKLFSTVTPENVQAWVSELPDCAAKANLLKSVEKHSAQRVGAINIANNKDAIYQYNYRTQGKQHYVASRVASSIALFNTSMVQRNTCQQGEMFVGGGKKTPNFKALFKSLVKSGSYNLVVFSFEYL